VFGLGEKKDGIWKVNFSVSEIIGISPEMLSRSSGAPVGIYNMGATCYLNTMISVSYIKQFFLPILMAGLYYLVSFSKYACPKQYSSNLSEQRALFK